VHVVEPRLVPLSRVVAEARQRISRSIDPHIVTTLLLMVPASEFDHALRHTCAESRVARHPDVVRVAFTWRYEKMPFVSPDELALNRILFDQYVSFRDANAAYHAWTASMGERAGDWVRSIDEAPDRVERSLRAAAWATGTQTGLDLLALGPDLVCLPENLALSPWMIGHGALESFCGGLTVDGKRISKGTGEAIGAVLNVLTAFSLAHGVLAPPEAPRVASVTEELGRAVSAEPPSDSEHREKRE